MTKDDIYPTLFSMSLYMLGGVGFAIVMIIFGNYYNISVYTGLAVISVAGIFLMRYSKKRIKTWKVSIDRPKRRMELVCLNDPHSDNSFFLSIRKRPMMGYALWFQIKDGPGMFIAGSKSEEILNALAKELLEFL
ncbi:hypothetical protein JW935_06615 [candidate division KSB1 bacterium]|nr:hypothetical protein [candidate division KSB1 bacterium]